MHNDTAYGLLGGGHVQVHKKVDGIKTRETSALKVIEFADSQGHPRHGFLPNGQPKPYKGYKGDSNYCIEIVLNEKGKWDGEVISTFEAYQLVRQYGIARLRHPTLSMSGKPLIMRLMKNYTVKLNLDAATDLYRVCWVRTDTRIAFAKVNEANVDLRDRDKTSNFSYLIKSASVLQKLAVKSVVISSIGTVGVV